MKLHDHRQTYLQAELLEKSVSKNPFIQFKNWFADAKNSNIKEPNAMTLATATAAGKPTARIVLLKEVAENGFVFFTNYESRKGKDVSENPFGQLLFFWDILERQVRIEGRLEKISDSASEAYFYSRPLESQYGAMVSNQSNRIASREILEQKLAALQAATPIRPPHWGGYVLVPTYFEFWQGRPSRLHDRIFYSLEHNTWELGRLSP